MAELQRRAVDMLVRSGVRAMRTGAPASAAAIFATVAELLAPADADPTPEAAGMRERAGEAAGAAGRADVAAEHFVVAAALYRRLDLPRDAARADAWVGEQLRRQGRYEEARTLLRSALVVLQEQPDADTVRALEHLAMLEIFAGSGEADELTNAALDLAEALALDDALLAQMFTARGIRNLTSGWVQASASLREAVRRAQAAQDAAATCRALANLAEGLLQTDVPESVASARAAVAHGRLVGDRYMLAFAEATLIEGLLLLGDWAEAEAVYQASVNDDGLEADPLVACVGAIVRVLRGDVDEAAALLPTVDTWADSEDPQDRVCMTAARAAIALGSGRYQSVLEQSRPVLVDVLTTGLITARWLWPTAVQAGFAADDLEAVRDLLGWLDRFPVGHVSPLLRAQRLQARAKLAAVTGEFSATAQLEDAVRAMRDVAVPHTLAEALLDAAEHHGDIGESDAARVCAEEALGIARRLGSTVLVARAAALGPVGGGVEGLEHPIDLEG